MTVTYTEGVKLLKRWHGSVWRSVWKDLLVWLVFYYLVRFILHVTPMNDAQKQDAVNVVRMFDRFCDKIPVSFLLGFYVVQVVSRWWAQVMNIPWPDEIMQLTNAYFPQSESKHLRQTVARWMILCQAMVFRRISTRIRRRFPKLDTLIDAGLLTNQECDLIRGTRCVNNRWQLPLQWIVNKIVAPSELPPPSKNNFILAINRFGESLRKIYIYDWIGIPLVYAQTCSVVVYGYFVFCAIGHQYIGQPIDLYVPWLTIFQLIFFVGWLQVGNDLMRPFGEDDDDVELNCILDRNAAVAINLAEQVAEENPDLIDDPQKQKEFQEKMMNNLAYSRSSLEKKHRDRPPKMLASVNLKHYEQRMIARSTSTTSPEVNISLRGGEALTVENIFPPSARKDGLKGLRTPTNLF